MLQICFPWATTAHFDVLSDDISLWAALVLAAMATREHGYTPDSSRDIPIPARVGFRDPGATTPKKLATPSHFRFARVQQEENKTTGGATQETLQPLLHLALSSWSSTHIHALTP